MDDRTATCCYTSTELPDERCMARRWEPLPMCMRHSREFMRVAILDGALPQDVMRDMLQQFDWAVQFRRSIPISEISPEVQREREERRAKKRQENSVVYYVRLTGGRIKIGYTTNLPNRLKAFRSNDTDLLATEPGGRGLEHDRHMQFAHLRIGRSEDFRDGPELLEHITSLRAHRVA